MAGMVGCKSSGVFGVFLLRGITCGGERCEAFNCMSE
jgi:hypothetical protein